MMLLIADLKMLSVFDFCPNYGRFTIGFQSSIGSIPQVSHLGTLEFDSCITVLAFISDFPFALFAIITKRFSLWWIW